MLKINKLLEKFQANYYSCASNASKVAFFAKSYSFKVKVCSIKDFS